MMLTAPAFVSSIAISLPEPQPYGTVTRRASSQGYATAVRTLLLKKLSGSVQANVVATNAPTVLRTVRHIASVPGQVQGGDSVVSGINLLMSTTSVATPDQLSRGLLLDAVEVQPPPQVLHLVQNLLLY